MELTKEQHEKFLTIATHLSPENLTCDGELSRSQVATRLRQLQGQWRRLETEVGRKVTEDEVWDVIFATYRNVEMA